MKKSYAIICAALLAAFVLAGVLRAENPILMNAKAETNPAKAIEYYWQYFDKVKDDSSYATASDDFADLLAENHRLADLVRFGDLLIKRKSILYNPLNTAAFALAQADTALEKALTFSQTAVAEQRKTVNTEPPADRTAKAWKERNEARLGYYLDTYASVLLERKDANKALEVLREAYSLTASEPDPDMCLHLAQAESQLHHPEEALNWALKAKFYLGDRENEDIQQVLHDSYGLLHGSGDGMDDYVAQHLKQMREEEYRKLIAEKLDSPAPDFQLKSLDGRSVKLSDLRGRTVLVDFWATWCGPCKRELPLFQAAYPDWKNKGIVFLAISTDKDTAKIAPFISENKYVFPVLFNQGTSKNYDVSGIPTLFVIDAGGRIQYRHVGYRPDVVDIVNLQLAELNKQPN